jgi:hypothetical protein
VSGTGPVAPTPPPAPQPATAAPVTAPAAPSTPATPSPTTVLQGGSPPPQNNAAAIDAASRELASGGQISAQVIARDNAALLIRTAAGNMLNLANLATLLEQANVAVLAAALKIQLNPQAPQQATVVSANGVTLQPPLTAQLQPPTAAQLAQAISPPQPGSAAPVVLPQPGQALGAVVVSPPPTGAAAGAALPLPTGSQLQVVVQSASLPAVVTAAPAAGAAPAPVSLPAAATPAVTTPATPSPTPAAPGVTPSLAATPPSIPASLPAPLAAALIQQQVAPPPVQTPATPTAAAPPSIVANPVPLTAAAPPQGAIAAQPLPQPAMTGQVLTGVVAGQATNGQVLVSTPQGILSLNLAQPLPPGTQLALEIAGIVRPPTPAPTSLGPPPLGSVLTRLQGEWPVLQQTLDAIRAADPALAQRLHDQLPQANARLAAAALQFMAAAAAGSAQAWLGAEAVRKLESQGKAELLKKLDDDFRELGRLNSRQGDNDWQALVMPMLIGGKVEPIQIFMRRRKDPKKKQAQTRFIIDFDLESTGPIQFDGFVGPKQLDLILRSESEFGPAFRVDVSAIFEEALAITGMVGSLRFHDREKPLPWPSPELEGRAHSTEIKA